MSEFNGYIVGIGAANVDLYVTSQIPLKMHYDHPSLIKASVGGVTTNILFNLALLDIPVKLISVTGDDAFGDMIRAKTAEAGIDTAALLTLENSSSSIFMQVMDDNKEMQYAFCDMSINKAITPDYLRSQKELLDKASAIIFDPSLSEDTLNYLCETYKDRKLLLDPVSDEYARKIIPYLPYIYAIKPNDSELAVLSGMEISTDEDIIKASAKLIHTGVRKVYATLGRKGSFYMDESTSFFRKRPPVTNIVNTSGAGDSFFAGVIYGLMNNLPAEESLDIGHCAAELTIQSESSINPKLSIESIYTHMKKAEE